MNVKEKSEKAGLKLQIQNTKIIASVPTISCKMDVETMTVTEFISLCSKITEDGHAAMKLKDASSFEEKLWST